MGLYELHRKETCGEADWPLRSLNIRVSVDADFGETPMPGPAQRRAILKGVLHALGGAEEQDVTILSNPIASFTQRKEEGSAWTRPEGIDLRVVKSAHRIVNEVCKRSQSGRAVLASELVGSIGLSAPTIGRLLRPGEQANEYLAQYLVVTPHGRTKALDLTPQGRMLASKIRAGVVPS